ncbi:hypothetical protein BJ165DRAFT_1074726 [Panaeolus papilionaceus]|nr:hypothetical protein BJ165DRAFT_1074726 [Panaeolus papilionaceus]
MSFLPIYNWLPGHGHSPKENNKPIAISSARLKVPTRALTHPLYPKLPLDDVLTVHVDLPFTQNGRQGSRHSRTRRPFSIYGTCKASIPQRSALFAMHPFVPQKSNISQDENEDSDNQDTDNDTPLTRVKTRIALPTPLIGMPTNKKSVPISPVGYKIIGSLPRDIQKFSSDNPDIASLRIIDPISTAECLLLLSICKELQHLDVVIDREEPCQIAQVEHAWLRTLRVYAFCDLSESLFHWLNFTGKADSEILWDSRVSARERNNCALLLQECASHMSPDRSF